MEIFKLFYNINSNIYVVGKKGQKCIVIDPGTNNNDCLVNYIKKNFSGVEAVLITHGHYDHIYGLEDLTKTFSPKVYIHFLEEEKLYDAKLNVSNFDKELELNPDYIDISCVNDGEILNILDNEIQVIHTPFHTNGSVCYYFKNLKALFSGDTLFHLSIGRFDLPTATPRTIISSLEKIKKLPPETKVYPGHEENTTIGNELNFNKYLKK